LTNWSSVLFEFTGRINRAKFWIGLLIAKLTLIASGFTAAALDLEDTVLLLLLPIPFWMIFAVCTKRLHDLDRSAWWLPAVILVPGFILALGLIQGTEGDNRFGADPLPTHALALE
jgi:uncharacterized membrane protein YhaH (DUF805 family)